MPSFSTRYVKKSYRSPSKSATELLATKLNTCMSPLYPSYKSQVVPAIVGVATVLPVEEMGPAPPRASSQTMISYSSLPVAEDEVNMSYETSATRSEPEYVQDQMDGMEVISAKVVMVKLVTVLAKDLTSEELPDQVHEVDQLSTSVADRVSTMVHCEPVPEASFQRSWSILFYDGVDSQPKPQKCAFWKVGGLLVLTLTNSISARLDRVPLPADGSRAGLDARRRVLDSGRGQGGAGQGGQERTMHVGDVELERTNEWICECAQELLYYFYKKNGENM